MIEGRCPKCGRKYYGWILMQPRNQSCTHCGVELLITEDGGRVVKGYSPFTADEYKIKTTGDISPDADTEKDTSVLNDAEIEQ